MDNESGIYIGMPEEKKVSEMPEEYQEKVRAFLKAVVFRALH